MILFGQSCFLFNFACIIDTENDTTTTEANVTYVFFSNVFINLTSLTWILLSRISLNEFSQTFDLYRSIFRLENPRMPKVWNCVWEKKKYIHKYCSFKAIICTYSLEVNAVKFNFLFCLVFSWEFALGLPNMIRLKNQRLNYIGHQNLKNLLGLLNSFNNYFSEQYVFLRLSLHRWSTCIFKTNCVFKDNK